MGDFLFTAGLMWVVQASSCRYTSTNARSPHHRDRGGGHGEGMLGHQFGLEVTVHWPALVTWGPTFSHGMRGNGNIEVISEH